MTTTHLATTRTASDSMLRLVLRLDAVASGLTGLAALAGVEFLPDLLGTPVALLVPVGIFLLAWAGALGYLASARPRPAHARDRRRWRGCLGILGILEI